MRSKRNHDHVYGSTVEMVVAAAVAEGTHHGSSPGTPVGDRALAVGEGRLLGVVEVVDKVEIHMVVEVGMVVSILQPNQTMDPNHLHTIFISPPYSEIQESITKFIDN